MTLPRLALIVVLLVLAFAAWVLWPEQPFAGKATKSDVAVKAPQVAASSSTPTWTPGSTPALPPQDTPLKEIRDQLVSRAMSGDAPAACRWAAELERCPRIPFIKSSIKRKQQDAQDDQLLPFMRERAVNEIERLEAQLAMTERVCDGVMPAETKVAWKFVLSAAEAGHIPSMLHFADGSVLREHMIPSRSESAEAWILYRARAASFLARAVEAGDPAAVFMSAFAYERGDWFGEPLLPKDRALALAHWQALQSVSAKEYSESLDDRIRKLKESAPLEPKEAVYVKRVTGEITAKMHSKGVRDVDFQRGMYPGGRQKWCE